VKSVVKLTIKLESLDEILPSSEWQVYGIACKLNNGDSLIKYVKPDSADLQSVPTIIRHKKWGQCYAATEMAPVPRNDHT
jgi:hypothetical protein